VWDFYALYSNMFVRWHRRDLLLRDKASHYTAILVESVRVGGKSRQRHIAFLGGITIHDGRVNAVRAVSFWHEVIAKLDKLDDRVSPEQRERIETALAKYLPRPTKQQYDDAVRSGRSQDCPCR